MIRVALVGLLLAAGVALGGPARAELPPAGPPPDPLAGERMDGRNPEPAGAAERAGLTTARVLLSPMRYLVKAVRGPIVSVIDDVPKPGWSSGPRVGPVDSGVRPVVRVNLADFPALGAQAWNRALFGRGVAHTSLTIVTAGPRYNEASFAIRPNRVLPVGGGLHLRARRNTGEAFYGVFGRTDSMEPPERTRVKVVSVDGMAELALRPGGGAGAWRLTGRAGGGLRRFEEGEIGDPPMAQDVPGFADGATFVRAELHLERFGTFDQSRQQSGMDWSFSVEPTAGVGWGDESRYVTARARAIWATPFEGGRALSISGYVADQASFGEDEINFYDLLSLGGAHMHRGFYHRRFQGQSAILASLDYRFPFMVWTDGVVFVENGGAFGEHFSGIEPAGFHTSVGFGVRYYTPGGSVVRLTAGWGLGEGPAFSLSFEGGE